MTNFTLETAYMKNGEMVIKSYTADEVRCDPEFILTELTCVTAFRIANPEEIANWNTFWEDRWSGLDDEFYYGYWRPSVKDENWYTYAHREVESLRDYRSFLTDELGVIEWLLPR